MVDAERLSQTSVNQKIVAAADAVKLATATAKYQTPPVSIQAFDCSYFVWLVIQKINPLFKRESSSAIPNDGLMFRPVVGPPQAGNIVYFPPSVVQWQVAKGDKRVYPGHVAVMVTPTSFVGMQDNGVHTVQLSNVWWSSRPMQFLQYVGPSK